MPPIIYQRFRREYDTHFASSPPLRRSIRVALSRPSSLLANVLKSRDRLPLKTIEKCLTLLLSTIDAIRLLYAHASTGIFSSSRLPYNDSGEYVTRERSRPQKEKKRSSRPGFYDKTKRSGKT